MYLTFTRPKISYTVNVLSQFMSEPSKSHLKATYRVLKYLKGSLGRGLFLKNLGEMRLQAFSDNDWGSCCDTRRSVSGFCVLFGDSLIS